MTIAHKFIIAALALGTVSVAAPASAAVEFKGTTSGCFTTSGTCSTAPAATVNGLTFLSGHFDQFTNAGGFAAIGGDTENLGNLTLAPNPAGYDNELFDLLVTFTLPTGTSAGSLFNAELTGSLVTLNDGGLLIHFTNPVQTFTSDAGTFTLTVADVNFSGSSRTDILNLTQNISGHVQLLPEPGTWGMMLLGFAGIGLGLRRRRPARMAQVA
jgi:hypothetical protein